eukprot:scaffold56838_cov67-Phaeocystis_antarctica.AAC.5
MVLGIQLQVLLQLVRRHLDIRAIRLEFDRDLLPLAGVDDKVLLAHLGVVLKGSADAKSSTVMGYPSTALRKAALHETSSDSRWWSAIPAMRPSSAKCARWSGAWSPASGLGCSVRPPSRLLNSPRLGSAISLVVCPNHSRRTPSPSAASPSNVMFTPPAWALT